MTEPKQSIAGRLDGSVNPHAEGWQAGVERAKESLPVVGAAYKSIKDTAAGFDEMEDIGDLPGAAANMVSNGAGFVAGAAADLTSFALDPLGSLISAGLDFLLELIHPLQDALHAVTGDGPSLEHAADNFAQIAQGFVELAGDFIATGDNALAGWREDAGDAARAALADFSRGIKGIGSAADAVSEVLKGWSMVMVIIEEVIKAIISELISWLLYIWPPALAASVPTFGGSVATAMAGSIAKGASTFAKVTKHLGKLGKLLDELLAFLGKLADKFPKLAARLKNLADPVAKHAVRESGTVGKRLGQLAGKAAGAAATTAATKGPGVLIDSFDDPVGGEQNPAATRSNLDI